MRDNQNKRIGSYHSNRAITQSLKISKRKTFHSLTHSSKKVTVEYKAIMILDKKLKELQVEQTVKLVGSAKLRLNQVIHRSRKAQPSDWSSKTTTLLRNWRGLASRVVASISLDKMFTLMALMMILTVI